MSLLILAGLGVLLLVLFIAASFLIPRRTSGVALIKSELKQRDIPYAHLPPEFFTECVDWAEKISSFTGHGTVVKKQAEFVRSIETLANMIQLWIMEPNSPMFATHGGRPSTYRTLFEKYDLRQGAPALVSEHYDWKSGQQTCPACAWVGLGSQTEIGETFGEGADYHCPKCNYRFGFIAYPLLSESLTDPRAPETDRMFSEIAMRNAKNGQDGAAP